MIILPAEMSEYTKDATQMNSRALKELTGRDVFYDYIDNMKFNAECDVKEVLEQASSDLSVIIHNRGYNQNSFTDKAELK